MQKPLPIASELEGYFCSPHDAPPKRLLMLTAYVDETGHESTEHVIVAGFMGNDEQWKNLASEWRRGLGNRKAIHLKELRWRSKSNYRVRELLERLGPIPRQCGLIPVFGGVRVSDYADLLSGSLVKKINKGYLLCLYPLIARVLSTLQGEERLKLVCEENWQYEVFTKVIELVCGAFAHSIFRTPSGLPRLAGIEFIPKASSSLTQPADYLAFAILQQHRDPTSLKARWTLPIIGDGKGIGKFMGRAELRKGIKITMAEERIKDLREVERLLDPILEHRRKLRADRKRGRK